MSKGARRCTDGIGDACGPGARYNFRLADPRRPGVYQPIELWIVEAVAPTLVAAGMAGGSEAYEEFVGDPGPHRRLRGDPHAVGHAARGSRRRGRRRRRRGLRPISEDSA